MKDNYFGNIPGLPDDDPEPLPEVEPTRANESPDFQEIEDPETGGLTVVITLPERRQIPRGYLSMLAEHGFTALEKYLTDHEAPKEIIDLVEAIRLIDSLQENDTGDNDEFLGHAIVTLAIGAHYAGIELAAGDSIFPA